MDREGEREADRLAGDFEGRRSSLGDGDFEADLASLSCLLSEWDGEQLGDFLLADFSLDRLRDSRSALLLDRLLERDLRVSERERDLLLLERLWDLRERDFSADLE